MKQRHKKNKPGFKPIYNYIGDPSEALCEMQKDEIIPGMEQDDDEEEDKDE